VTGMRLTAQRLAVDLPRGWDGRIQTRRPEPAGAGELLQRGRAPATLHAASFALPPKDGDFGSKATAAMSEGDVFLALTEYVEGSGLRAGNGLFRSRHLPRALDPAMFSPRTLLVARRGQAGFQHFFTAAGRPFCLYAVAGSIRPAAAPLRQLNGVLSSLRIESRR
jgi:hypothetical protein